LARIKREKYQRNPEKYRERNRQRADWLRQGDVTKAELQAIYARDGGQCVYCKNAVASARFWPSAPTGFDHVVSRANGGQHTASNLVVSCRACNCAKR